MMSAQHSTMSQSVFSVHHCGIATCRADLIKLRKRILRGDAGLVPRLQDPPYLSNTAVRSGVDCPLILLEAVSAWIKIIPIASGASIGALNSPRGHRSLSPSRSNSGSLLSAMSDGKGAAGDRAKLIADFTAWAGNVSSSVGIIFINKVLMSTTGYGFRYGEVP